MVPMDGIIADGYTERCARGVVLAKGCGCGVVYQQMAPVEEGDGVSAGIVVRQRGQGDSAP